MIDIEKITIRLKSGEEIDVPTNYLEVDIHWPHLPDIDVWPRTWAVMRLLSRDISDEHRVAVSQMTEAFQREQTKWNLKTSN